MFKKKIIVCNIYNNVLLMPIVAPNLKLNWATSATGRQPSQPSQSKTARHKYCIPIQDGYPPQKQNQKKKKQQPKEQTKNTTFTTSLNNNTTQSISLWTW